MIKKLYLLCLWIGSIPDRFIFNDSFFSHSEQQREDASSDMVSVLIEVSLEAAVVSLHKSLGLLSVRPSDGLRKREIILN